MFENANVLVAGSTGLVGHHLSERLLGLGAKVRGTCWQSLPKIKDPRMSHMRVDLTNPLGCKDAVKDMDYVVLCAASTSGAATIQQTPMVHVTPNVVINSYMLEAAYDAGVKKFIWLSSTTGYPPSGERYVEEDEMFNGEPYEKYFFVGWMKRFTEVLCEMYGNKLPKNMPAIVLRPTNIYGPHDKFDPQKSHVLPALIRKALEKQNPFEVWGDGNDVRDFIYVDDMVDAIILALEKETNYDPMNIGYGKTYSVKEILDIILDETDFHPDVVFNSNKPSMIPIRRASVQKAKDKLGFEAKVGIREGIRKTIEWYKNECLSSHSNV